MKWLLIFMLLVPSIVLAKNCPGNCVEGTNCSDGGYQLNYGCEAGYTCCQYVKKCCIISPNKECSNALTIQQVMTCDGILIDGACPSDCSVKMPK